MSNQDNEQSGIQDRKTLQNFFRRGGRPTEEHFRKLINSTFNKADDDLNIDKRNGLMLYGTANEGNLLSLYDDKDDEEATWKLITQKKKGLLITEKEDLTSSKESANPAFLFLQNGGGLGIGTDNPVQALDVNGIIAADGRIGQYKKDSLNIIPADGRWHNVFKDNLEGCHAFELMVYAGGEEGKGKYSLMHAIAICIRGDSRPKIKKTIAHYDKWWNKVNVRWESRKTAVAAPEKDRWWKNIPFFREKKENEYNLQVKTRSDFGKGHAIHCAITVLWNNEIGSNRYYRNTASPSKSEPDTSAFGETH